MPTSSDMAWLFTLSAGVPILFYIVAFIFVIRQRTVRDSARTYLIFGISLLLIQNFGGIVARVFISRFTTPNNITVMAVYSLLSSLLFVLAIFFLIAADVAGRQPPEAEQRFVRPLNDNPYTPPQS